MKSVQYYNYEVFEDGRVFSNIRNKFLTGEITHKEYLQYTLSINKSPYRIKAHRLVAQLFLPPHEEDKTIINHIDGNKLNNHYSNLEWTTYYGNNLHARVNGLNDISESNHNRWNDKEWAKRTAKNISDGQLRNGCSKGESNPRFRYRIYDENNNLYNRLQLKELLGCSQSYTDSIIRKLANHLPVSNNVINEYGIYVIDMKTHQ